MRYTYGFVVGTLIIIESPENDTYVPVPVLGDEKTLEAALLEPQVLHIKTKPITSSLRSTVLHLRACAGYWSRFRGLSLFLCWTIVRGFLSVALTHIPFIKYIISYGVAGICFEVILARWELTWYHIVISKPSPKKWYQRVPAFRTSWPKIAPAVALRAVSQHIVATMPMMLCSSLGTMNKFRNEGFNKSFEHSEKELYTVFWQSLMILFLIFALFILLEVPAMVTVVRVAASMLPEEDEAIVPFDRTFGGKVTPTILGGTGKIGMLDAWRSFAWSSKVRLLKFIAKVVAILLAVWVLFSMIFLAEAHLFGDQLAETLRAVEGRMHGH